MAKKKRKARTTPSDFSNALRRLWRFSPERRDFLEKVRFKQDGVWSVKCAHCWTFMRQNDAHVDHVIPVGTLPGSKKSTLDDSWDKVIYNLFWKPDNLQILCKDCHRSKTNQERFGK
jgi:5-methylcytosine-specific restriction endonuclease McrA